MRREHHEVTLTDEEKARIRAEVIYRDEVRREASSRPSTERSRVFEFLNSKFFISVIAGSFLTIAPKIYADARAQSDRASARDNALRDKRLTLVSSVANDLSAYSSLKGSWQVRKVWLAQHKDDDLPREGVPHKDVQATYTDLYNRMMAIRRPGAVLAEIRSFFDSGDVLSKVNALDKAMDAVSDATTDEDVRARCKDQDKTLDALISAMSTEARAHVSHD